MWGGKCQRRNSNGGIQLPLKALVPLTYGKFHIQHYNRVTQSPSWKSLRWLPEPHWVSCPARLSRVFKRLPPQTRCAHTVCVSNTIVAQTLWSGIAAGNDYEKYLSCRSGLTNTHMYCITQNLQRDISHRQLIQHNVFMRRFFFFFPTANTLFDRNYDSQLAEENSSCTTNAVVDSFAFLFTRHCASTSPKWKLHII